MKQLTKDAKWIREHPDLRNNAGAPVRGRYILRNPGFCIGDAPRAEPVKPRAEPVQSLTQGFVYAHPTADGWNCVDGMCSLVAPRTPDRIPDLKCNKYGFYGKGHRCPKGMKRAE